MRTWQYAELTFVTTGHDPRYRLVRLEGIGDEDLADYGGWEVYTGNRGTQTLFTASLVAFLNHLGRRGWRVLEHTTVGFGVAAQAENTHRYSLVRSSDDQPRV